MSLYQPDKSYLKWRVWRMNYIYFNVISFLFLLPDCVVYPVAGDKAQVNFSKASNWDIRYVFSIRHPVK
jgi:hypothetical protein